MSLSSTATYPLHYLLLPKKNFICSDFLAIFVNNIKNFIKKLRFLPQLSFFMILIKFIIIFAGILSGLTSLHILRLKLQPTLKA